MIWWIRIFDGIEWFQFIKTDSEEERSRVSACLRRGGCMADCVVEERERA